MTPHKHAEVIKKWADGHPIQFRHPGGTWSDIDDPKWYLDTEYRVKPAVKWIALFRGFPEAHYYNSEDEAMAVCFGVPGFIKVVSVEIEP